MKAGDRVKLRSWIHDGALREIDIDVEEIGDCVYETGTVISTLAGNEYSARDVSVNFDESSDDLTIPMEWLIVVKAAMPKRNGHHLTTIFK